MVCLLDVYSSNTFLLYPCSLEALNEIKVVLKNGSTIKLTKFKINVCFLSYNA